MVDTGFRAIYNGSESRIWLLDLGRTLVVVAQVASSDVS
jgi:hypothetical protein